MYGFRTGAVGGCGTTRAHKIGQTRRRSRKRRDKRRPGGLDEATGKSIGKRSHIAELR